ncbi:hypothetical protein DSO57_1000739 [Entomophthora muscae]|uniref:Uncharacterized protein n=1 Tax=Entomophthora muscae TaxID=34485 RepID=A0ACC2T903_9FUNG|nr:hypothetical protein DSO57_1000739 [Entomophthora muscae]
MSLISDSTKLKVSSVLNKETRTYGKDRLVDRNPETCWNSDTGLPQSILIDFGAAVTPSSLRITFQGGFVGLTGQLSVALGTDLTCYHPINQVYFDDINLQQNAQISLDQVPASLLEQASGINRLKITFTESSDFFGRITIYDLDIV